MGVNEPVGGQATTLVGVLNQLAVDGYGDGQLIALDDGTFRCSACDSSVPADELDLDGFRRLEGASDPDDMHLVVWGACPRCGARSIAVLGFGPTASTADMAVMEQLDLDDVAQPGHIGDEA